MSTATTSAGPRARGAKDPFAALPHWIAGDPRVSPLGKAVLLALLYWAKNKDHCFPSDAAIGRRVGRSEATVQRALRHLQGLGLIDRQKTDANRTGRVIRLTWRTVNAEGSPPSGTTGRRVADLRDEGDVLVKGDGGKEIRNQLPERLRPEPPAPVESPVLVQPLVIALTQVLGPRTDQIAQEARQEPPVPEEAPRPARAPAAPPSATELASLPSGVSQPSTPASGPPESLSPPTRTATWPIPQPSTPPVLPAAPCPVVGPRALAGLTPREQVRLRELPEATRQQILQWLALGDPICLGEAKRLLRPPRPPEPPPQALATPELLLGLPGRPDRIAAAAGRLAEELRDPASYSYFQSLAEAVCARRQPVEALINARKEGLSEKARRPAAVFTYAWKRATRPAG